MHYSVSTRSLTSIFRILPVNRSKHYIYFHCHQTRLCYWLKLSPELIGNVLPVKSLCVMSWDVSKLKSKLPSVISQDLRCLNANILNKTQEQILPNDIGSCTLIKEQQDSNKTHVDKYFTWSASNSHKRKSLDMLNTGSEKMMKMQRFAKENTMDEELPFCDNKILKYCDISTAVNMKNEFDKQEHSASSRKKERIDNKRTVPKDINYLVCSNVKEPVYHPTHCLVVKVTNTSVREKLADLKSAVESLNPDFASCFVPRSTLHVPLVTMTINNPGDIQQVYNVLEQSLFEITKLTSAASKTSIEFTSLGNFQGKVVFLNVEKNEGLNYFKKVRKLLCNSLRTLNINVRQEQFKRGVSIMKLSNCFPLINVKGIDKIPTDVYDVCKDNYYGEQELNEILFCSMSNRKESDEFYNVLAAMNLMDSKLYITDGEVGNKTIQMNDEVQIPHQNEVEEMIIDNCDSEILLQKYEHSMNEKPVVSNGKGIDKMKMVSKLSKNKRKEASIQQRTNSSDDSKSSNFKSKKARPTHFLAFRLKNPVIHKKATELQEAVVNINKDFKPSFVAVPTLHVTLAVLTLNNKEEIDIAIKALRLSMERLNDVYNKALCKFIEFGSLGTFNGKVLFVDVEKTDGLQLLKSIVSILKDALLQQNVVMTTETFTPHVTIMKLSKGFKLLKKKGIKKIPEDLYKAQQNDYFGKEELIEILLCSMCDKKTDDGFYKILASINLKSNKVTGSDNKTLGTSNSSVQNSVNDEVLSSAHKQMECSKHTLVTIFPETEEIDPNYPSYLYGNIFVRMCVNVYIFLLEYFLKLIR